MKNESHDGVEPYGGPRSCEKEAWYDRWRQLPRERQVLLGPARRRPDAPKPVQTEDDREREQSLSNMLRPVAQLVAIARIPQQIVDWVRSVCGRI